MLRLYLHEACRLLDGQCAGGLADTALAQAGLHRADLRRLDRPLHFDHYCRVLHWLYQSRVLPVPGLQLGLLRRIEDFGPYGQASGSVATFGEVLRLAERFFSTCWAHARLRVTQSGSTLVCHYQLLPTTVCAPEVQLQALTAMAMGLGRRLLPRMPWSQAEVRYGFAKPIDAALYHRLLGCSVRFGAPATEVRVPAAWLHEAPVADSATGPTLVDALALCVARDRQGSMVDQVRRQIEERCSEGFPMLAEVAAALGCSARTVERRLAQAGTSYRQELEHVRMRLAERYLTQTALGLGDISRVLGYAHPPSFQRAFRARFGITPQQRRRAAVA